MPQLGASPQDPPNRASRAVGDLEFRRSEILRNYGGSHYRKCVNKSAPQLTTSQREIYHVQLRCCIHIHSEQPSLKLGFVQQCL